jgi:hypothetical protein
MILTNLDQIIFLNLKVCPEGSVFRFINNAMNADLTNCRFGVEKVEGRWMVYIVTTKDVKNGCELFIVYNDKKKYITKTSETKDALEQRIKALTFLLNKNYPK